MVIPCVHPECRPAVCLHGRVQYGLFCCAIWNPTRLCGSLRFPGCARVCRSSPMFYPGGLKTFICILSFWISLFFFMVNVLLRCRRTRVSPQIGLETYGSVTMPLKVLSLNVQGLNSPQKRRTAFDHFHKHRADVICLQETRLPQPSHPNTYTLNITTFMSLRRPTRQGAR